MRRSNYQHAPSACVCTYRHSVLRQIPIAVFCPVIISAKDTTACLGVSPLMPLPFHTPFYYFMGGSSFVFSDLHRESALCLLTPVAWSFLEHTSRVNWDRWGWPDFSPQSPSERTDCQTQNAVLFPGWEEAKHEGREGRERREGRDIFPRAREVNTLMFDDSSPRGDSLSLSHPALSLPPRHPRRVIFVFPPGDERANHLVYFRKRTN